MTMGEIMRKARGEKTQDQVAADLGISKSAYAMYEKDKRIPRDEVKITISRYFGIPIQDLFFANYEH